MNLIFDHGFEVTKFHKARLAKRKRELDKRIPKLTHFWDDGTETIIYPIIRNEDHDLAEAMLQKCPELMNETGIAAEGTRLQNYGWMKPLHMCAANGDYEGLKLLIKYGADVNEPTGPGEEHRNVLGLLCDGLMSPTVRLKCAQLLIENGFTELNMKDVDGSSALILAARRNDMPLVNLLLKVQADPTLSDTNDVSALWYLTANNDPTNKYSDILPLLYANIPEHFMRAGISSWSYRIGKITPQMLAIYRQDIPSVRAFIESGWFIHETRYKDPKFEKFIQSWSRKNVLWLEDAHFSSPPKLKWWAKRVVRRALPLFPSNDVNLLALPEPLKDYILKVDDIPPKETRNLCSFKFYNIPVQTRPHSDVSGFETSSHYTNTDTSYLGSYDYDREEDPWR